MAGKNYLYVDYKSKAKAMSNITFIEETSYKAYEKPKAGGELFVSINQIAEYCGPETVEYLVNKAMEENKQS